MHFLLIFLTEPDDNTPKCFSNLYCESDFQLLSKSPYEPWQDDIGRLASVHDFINFVCFHGKEICLMKDNTYPLFLFFKT